MSTKPRFKIGSKDGSVKSKVRDFLFGLFLFELHQENRELSKKYRDSVELVLFAEFLGIPFMASHVTLKLLPYFLNNLNEFKAENLREHDILSQIAEHELH